MSMTWILIVSAAGCIFGSGTRGVLALSCLLQLGYLAQRGFSLGRLPLLGPHDTLVFFAACLAVTAACVSQSAAVRHHRWFRVVSGFLAGFTVLFALFFPPLMMPLPRILDTLWFELHVVLAFLAYALFAVGALLGGAFLVSPQSGIMDLQYKTALTGWTFFSGSMIAGGIWGYYAWGTYWLWTPKELWTSVLWLFYAVVLHIRLKGAAGNRWAARLSIAGAFIMLFTYLGVSMLMKSSHSF